MRVPRFQSRRDSNVVPAGYFSVLKTASRTVTVRRQGDYRSLAKPSSAPETSTETAEQPADRPSTTKIPLIGDSGMMDRGLIRMALIVFAAASFTFFILWWMSSARP